MAKLTASFATLPFELQCQILANLYDEWYLFAEKVNTFNARPVYTFASSAKHQFSPFLVCKAMSAAASTSLKLKFSGTLAATNIEAVYSIIPKFKKFLPMVSRLALLGYEELRNMGSIYCARLPALKTILIVASKKKLWAHSSNPFEGSVNEIMRNEADGRLRNSLDYPSAEVNKSIQSLMERPKAARVLYRQDFYDFGNRVVVSSCTRVSDAAWNLPDFAACHL